MIKIVVVDDEPLVREFICNLISSKPNDYKIIGDCYSGENALEFIEKNSVDIVITDIKMAKMSGIILIEEIKKIAPNVRFVILSAYNDFNFVRNSFQLGVEDYLVKTEINYDRIINLLDKIKEKIIFSDNDNQKNILKTTLMKELVLGGNQQSELLCQLKNYNFAVQISTMRVMVIKIVDYYNYIKNEFDFDEVLIIYGIENIMREILKEVNLEYECFYRDNGEFIVFCSFSNILSESKRLNQINEAYNKLKCAIMKFIGKDIIGGISDYYKDKIYNLFLQAGLCCEMNFFNSATTLVSYEKYFDSTKTIDITPYNNQIDDILDKFSKGDFDFNLLKPQVSNNTKNDVVLLKEMYEKYFYKVSEYAHKYELTDCIANELNDYFNYFKNWGTLTQVHLCLKEVLDKLVENSNVGLSQNVIRYIMKNYEKSISLNEVGDFLGMNGNYVGRMFKKEVGIGFLEYLINVRIDKSIELIRKNKYNINQISQMCGFNNVEHFSRSFKKITKKSPKNFMKD